MKLIYFTAVSLVKKKEKKGKREKRIVSFTEQIIMMNIEIAAPITEKFSINDCPRFEI